MARIQKIRQKIIDRAYYISSHAEEKMLDDELVRDDIKNAVAWNHATTLDAIDRYLSTEHHVKGQLSVKVVSMV